MSLFELKGNEFVPKQSFLAWRVAARIFSRIKNYSFEQNERYSIANIARVDGINISVVSSNLEDRELSFKLPKGAKVFRVYGTENKKAQENGVINLSPKPKPYLSGECTILVY